MQIHAVDSSFGLVKVRFVAIFICSFISRCRCRPPKRRVPEGEDPPKGGGYYYYCYYYYYTPVGK